MSERAGISAGQSAMRGCPHCGCVQRVTAPAATITTPLEARCARCGGVILRTGDTHRSALCAALALAALVCYLPGILLPVMRLEQLGHVQAASIWAGTVSLLAHGEWVVGMVVLVCSIVLPVAKLVGLFVLTLRPGMLRRTNRARVYRIIELAGRWGMIDVLLVALLVAALKLGDVVSLTPGPGVTAFGTCVVLSLLASAVFDPHAIWEMRDA